MSEDAEASVELDVLDQPFEIDDREWHARRPRDRMQWLAEDLILNAESDIFRRGPKAYVNTRRKLRAARDLLALLAYVERQNLENEERSRKGRRRG